MAHLRRIAPQLVSPTPIRPHSPAGSPSRDRSDTPTKAAYLGADRSGGAGSSGGDDEVAGEISANQELMQIFQGSPRCAPPGPTDSCVGYRDNMQPPSRNQNPLVKDQLFSNYVSQSEADVFANALSTGLLQHQIAASGLIGEMLRSACASPPQSDVGVLSSA